MKNFEIGDATLGIDMLSDETSLPKGAMRDAVNVDIDVYGNWSRRKGARRLSTTSGAHSLWGSRDRTFGLYAQNDLLRKMAMVDGQPAVKTLLSGLWLSERMSFYEYADEVFFTNGHDLGVVNSAGARLLGVEDPAGAPGLTALQVGALAAGRYAVAYSYVDARGEESGLSPATFIELSANGGIRTALPFTLNADKIRVYVTSTNGDIMYLNTTVPMGQGSVDLLDNTLSKAVDTQFKHRMPPGEIVRAYNGRLLVASGSVLTFSEPYRYGLTDRRHNFVHFQAPIRIVEPVVDGVYVGTSEAVYFLAGGGPGQFQQSMVSTNVPVAHCSTTILPAMLEDDVERAGDSPVALWLGRVGYSLGMPGGAVKDVQSERIVLPVYDSGSIAAFTHDGMKQVVSITKPVQSGGFGGALDTAI